VPRLSHEPGEINAGVASGGGEARAQRVPGEALRPLDLGVLRGLADEARDRAVAQPGSVRPRASGRDLAGEGLVA
jgi:hypothetical protein